MNVRSGASCKIEEERGKNNKRQKAKTEKKREKVLKVKDHFEFKRKEKQHSAASVEQN